jgi:large subunit ribosomal protein L15
MQLHQLKRLHKHKKSKRVGRGGKRGKTAGRGTKGQKARAGHRLRPELRDIIKKYPKLRGYKFKSIATKPTPINLELIEATFAAGDTVSPETLFAKKLITKDGGRMRKVKILASGKLTKKITLSGCLVSASAKAAIEAAGGIIN